MVYLDFPYLSPIKSNGQNEKPDFDPKISLFRPSNLSRALILEPKGPQPQYSDFCASLGSLNLEQAKKKMGADHLYCLMTARYLKVN